VPEAIQKRYEKNLAKWKEEAAKAKENKQRPSRPPTNPSEKLGRKNDVGGLFNGKIAPLIPYAIRGTIWYQGEANSTPEKAPFYGAQLKLLISDWRTRWQSELPFAWAQLPNFGGAGREWPLVREGMLKTLALPNTGMGINIDIGEENNIHPTNKQEVGRRLSLWALGTVYQKKVDSISGPLPSGHEIRSKEFVLKFSHTDGGLIAKNGDLTGFVLAGADKQWKPAQARIEKDQVILTSSEVSEPVAARYAWENFPSCNLYNGAGLPASPFRTDDW
jgi:sialate O-acetylesterase